MKCCYLGSFPPPYGGVTNKNQMLFSALSQKIDIERIYTECKGPLAELLCFAKAVLSSHPLVIGLGSNGKLGLLTQVLAAVRRKKRSQSIVFVMGGTFHTYVDSRPKLARALAGYARVFVETPSMAESLKSNGVMCADVFPNCRVRPESRQREVGRADDSLRCLYFANVCEEKGADVALEVAARLPDVRIDFWGEFLSEDYKVRFMKKIEKYQTCTYKGVYKVANDNVYAKMAEYDLLLFPSTWTHEGVAGTLVESKVAGVPAVAFNNNFNAEVVVDGVEGLLVAPGDIDGFVAAVDRLDKDRGELAALSLGAGRSAERYFLDSYLDEILAALR